jgi:hypothetical protein
MFIGAWIACTDLVTGKYKSGLIYSVVLLAMAYELGTQSFIVERSRIYVAVAYGLPVLAVLVGLIVAAWKFALH